MSSSLFSKDELYKYGKQRSYKNDAGEAAFLLGGIGTGNVSIGARGEFRDWEIFNKPGKGNMLPYTFFAIWTKEEGKKPLCKVFESQINPPFSKSHGFGSDEVAGLPRFKESELRGEYPIVWVTLKDDSLPVEVILEDFTPFIPLNPDDSGIPCAVLKYRVKNISKGNVDVTIAGSISNPVGFNGYNVWKRPNEDYLEGNTNEYKTGNGVSGLYMYSSTLPANHLKKMVKWNSEQRNCSVVLITSILQLMASWAVILALSGFHYDMVNGTMSFKPVINQDFFSTFWSTGKAWGIYNQKKIRNQGKLNGIFKCYMGIWMELR